MSVCGVYVSMYGVCEHVCAMCVSVYEGVYGMCEHVGGCVYVR